MWVLAAIEALVQVESVRVVVESNNDDETGRD